MEHVGARKLRYLGTLRRSAGNVPEHDGTRLRDNVTPRMFRIVPAAELTVSRPYYPPLEAIKPFWPASRGCSGFAVAVVTGPPALGTLGNDREHE